MRVTPDKQKAISLQKSSEITLKRIRDTDINKYSSNVLKDYYDVIHGLFEALSSLHGVKFSGEGAHEQLINYVCSQCKFEEKNRVFLQELRTYRNRISYEGFFVEADYVLRKKEFIEAIILQIDHILQSWLKNS